MTKAKTTKAPKAAKLKAIVVPCDEAFKAMVDAAVEEHSVSLAPLIRSWLTKWAQTGSPAGAQAPQVQQPQPAPVQPRPAPIVPYVAKPGDPVIFNVTAPFSPPTPRPPAPATMSRSDALKLGIFNSGSFE